MKQIDLIEAPHRKPALAQVQSGDTVRVHQRIREGAKQRIQIFEGMVIRTKKLGEISASITVRRIASGVGVEKTFLLHSPNIVKVDVVRRSKVRRNFLSYLRARKGKATRLQEKDFDREATNVSEPEPSEQVAAESNISADSADSAAVAEVANGEEVVSTEELAKEEDKAAASDGGDQAGADTPNEQELPSVETESGKNATG